MPWNWRSFGEFLSRIDGKAGLNIGFFAGHSAIRRAVMGERAVGEEATPEDIAALDPRPYEGTMTPSRTAL